MVSELVSVIVVAYNSSDYITETLESISGQTWDKLELIITDDCSEDDTVEVCCKWLDKNKQRFLSTTLLTSDRNTGVTANANRGLYASCGEWIKFLGADDTLKPDCIRDNMDCINSDHKIKALFSQIEIYKDTFDAYNLTRTIPETPLSQWDILDQSRSSDSQYRMLLTGDRINFSPSVFLNRAALFSVGGLDERFSFVEDYPLWLNLTKNGYKLHFMEKVTVNYRQHSKAVNNTGKNFIINPNYFKTEPFRKVYTYPFLPSDVRLCQRYTWYASQIFRNERCNRNALPNRNLLRLLTIYLNPFRYYIWIRKRLFRSLRYNEFYY